MFLYKIQKNNTTKYIVIVAGIIFTALVMFILYKYVFNTSDCDGTNIECCLEDCSGNAPDCDIKTRKCFCKKGLDCDNNCTGNGPPCGICKDSEKRDVYCGCIPSEDLSKCLKNSDLYELYSNNNCNYQVGGYCDCMGNVYDCKGECGGSDKSCKGCDGILGSGKKVDKCGKCGGNNECADYVFTVSGMNGNVNGKEWNYNGEYSGIPPTNKSKGTEIWIDKARGLSVGIKGNIYKSVMALNFKNANNVNINEYIKNSIPDIKYWTIVGKNNYGKLSDTPRGWVGMPQTSKITLKS